MYRKIENGPHMTCNEVAERYPKDYILMQRDNRDLFDPAGVVLYVGDNFTELFGLQVDLDIPLGIVVEGSYHRCSLGGLVVGE